MSTGSEYGEFEKYRGVSVRTVFEHQVSDTQPKHRFTPRLQERFIVLEQTHLSPEGEPIFLYELARASAEGRSLRSIGGQYGLTHRQIGTLLQVAAIPYATREEAVQRLWSDPQFREKNGAAQAEVRGKYWQDPKKRESAAAKLRDSALRQWEDPEFRELVVAASSKTSKQRWQDPKYRAKMVRNRVIFDILRNDPNYLTTLSEIRRAQWQDPEFYAKNAEISRQNLAAIKQRPSYRQKRSEQQRKRWEDPKYRRKMSEQAGRNLSQLWKDPEFYTAAVERSRELMTRLNQDPEFRIKGAKARSERFMDSTYRKQASEVQRQIALALWEDSEYRAKLSETHKALWQDPEYRKNQGAALRTARLDPANRDHMVLPTIHGFRSDIGFYAQSAWEANIARVFQLICREYVVGINLRLDVTEDFQEFFQDSETTFNIDFSTIDGRGRTVMYELMAHPLETPLDWAKLEMARRQNPDLLFRAIDENFYNRLQKRFENAINSDPQLHGWEKTGFNLRTHPEIFA